MNMAELSGLLAQCFEWILRASWQAGVLIVAVLLIQGLLRRHLSAGWRSSLWLLVVVRLLLPFSAESSLSVFNLVTKRPAVSAVQEAKVAESEPVLPSTNVVATTARVEEVTSKAVPAPASENVLLAEADPVPAPQRTDVIPLPPVAPKRLVLTGWEIVAWLWLAGVIGLSMHVAVTMIGMVRKVRRATPAEDEAVLRLFETCRQQMNVRTRLPLLETDIVKSPALFGVFRPSLLLPLGMVHSFTQTELRYVFLHELAHVKRRDVSLNWVLTVLQIVHWFNPVIWFGFARMRTDRELACDALAISSAGETEAKAYGQTIIKLLETLSQPARRPGLVGIMEDKSQMERRISMIARFKKRRRRSILALGFAVVLAVTGLTDAVKSTKAEAVSPAKEAAPGDAISVTIMDAESGKPVSGASVVSPYSNNIRFGGPPPIKPADEMGRVTLSRGEVSQMGFGVLHPEYAPLAVTWNWATREPLKKRPEVPSECTVKLDRGVEIGGTVVDENGKPVPNVRVEIKGSTYPKRDTEELTALEYPFYETLFGTCPVTDENGRWTCAHFPREIELLQIDCIRPDNSCVQFHTEKLPWYSSLGGELIKQADIRAKNAVFVLKKGISVRGVVVGASGNPLAGVSLKETDGRQHSKPLAEIVTGKDGRFELPNRDPHQILIKATGAGYASNPTVVNIEPEMPEVRIQMTPAVPLRVRVVDESGRPISKMQMTPVSKVGWNGTTDAEGRIVWNDPPVEPLAYQIYAENHGFVIKRLTPSESEQIIQIRKGETPSLHATVRAQTAEKEPLKSFTVSAISEHRAGSGDELLGEGKDGIFSDNVPLEKTGGSEFRLKIEAPGFEPFMTDKLSSMTDVEVSVSLRKTDPRQGGAVQGVVLLSDGRPAVGAKLLIPEAGDSSPFISLRYTGANRAPESESGRVRTVRVDTAGRYSLPAVGNDHIIVVVHAEGFAETKLSQLKSSSEVRLQPWGRLEGTYLMNSQPKENVRLMLHPKARLGYSLWIQNVVDTDKNGNFRVEQLPPGEYTLYGSKVSHGTWPQNHPFPVKVEAGETAKVTYACEGRTITGRVQLNAPYLEIDWANDVEPQMLTARRNIERDEPPVFENFVRMEDYQKAFEQWRTARRSGSPETYAPQFDSDGSFRIEGVPEGTYDLELGITKGKSERGEREKPIGSLKREIIVPRGSNNEPVDVGVLEIPVQADLIPKRPIATLAAKTPEGHAFDLAHYRGKLVLLTFWAPWAKPSAEDLAQWRSVSEAFGTHPNIALIGVALSDKPGVPAQLPEFTELNWNQAQLEGRSKTSTTEAWGVDNLPVTFLVSPEGGIIARDIKPERVRALIEKSLQANK